MEKVHVFCFFASYVLALAADGGRLLKRNAATRVLPIVLGVLGLAAHSIYLLVRSGEANLPPLLSSNHDWLLVLAWVAVVFYIILAVIDPELPFGLFLLPIVLILIGAANLVGTLPNPLRSNDVAAQAEAVAAAHHGWKMLHASLLVFGIGGVIIGLIFSLMYLVQHRRLKHRQGAPDGMSLPSLASLARLNWWSVMISIPLLTLGMLTGVHLAILDRGAPGKVSLSDPLVVGSTIVWLVMVAFFAWFLRADRAGGKQVAWRTIWNFGFLLLTLIALQVLTGGHRHPATSPAADQARTPVSIPAASPGDGREAGTP